MKIRRNIALAAFGVVLGTVVILTQAGWSESKSYKLEGAWIGKVPGYPIMWSYAVSPDPSGRTASMSGSVQVPLQPSLLKPGVFPDLEYISPMVGSVRMTGPNTFEATAVWYGMKKGFPFNQVVFIGLNNAQAVFLDSGQMIMTNNLAFYDPTADADGDGLPDPGATPALALPPATTVETRLPL